MRHHFGDSLDIKDTDTVWILCPGASLDEFDLALLKPEHITISLNSSITVYPKPTYQMVMDFHAISGYHQYHKDPTIWLTQPKFEKKLIELKLPFISRNDLIEQSHDLRFRGSGSDAILFAYFLSFYQPTITQVCCVGMDMCEVIIDTHAYFYSSQVSVLSFQKSLQLPDNWHSKNYHIKRSVYSSYNAQRTTISTILDKIPDFREKLKSYSWYDFQTQTHDRRVII